MGLTVGIVVLGVIAVVGAAGYLLDKSAERHHRK
jgi:hypothetical protein